MIVSVALFNADGQNLYVGPLDMAYDGSGRVVFNTGLKVTDQAIVKALLTRFGANKIRLLYGAALSRLKAAKMMMSLAASLITSDVGRVVGRIQSFMNSVPGTSSDQRIAFIQDILVQQDPSNPTVNTVAVSVMTQAGKSFSSQSSPIQF